MVLVRTLNSKPLTVLLRLTTHLAAHPQHRIPPALRFNRNDRPPVRSRRGQRALRPSGDAHPGRAPASGLATVTGVGGARHDAVMSTDWPEAPPCRHLPSAVAWCWGTVLGHARANVPERGWPERCGRVAGDPRKRGHRESAPSGAAGPTKGRGRPLGGLSTRSCPRFHGDARASSSRKTRPYVTAPRSFVHATVEVQYTRNSAASPRCGGSGRSTHPKGSYGQPRPQDEVVRLFTGL